jgi:hypothetical protein
MAQMLITFGWCERVRLTLEHPPATRRRSTVCCLSERREFYLLIVFCCRTLIFFRCHNHFRRSCDRASLMNSFKYNQQDATLYNILYYCQCSTCFRRFLRPSSGDQNCTHSIWYMSSLLAATASGNSKQAWHVPDAVCTVFELLMMGGGTAPNMWSIDNNKEYCITLHLVGCT